MITVEEADAMVDDLAALYEASRVREQQIRLSRCYWAAKRLADHLRATAAAA